MLQERLEVQRPLAAQQLPGLQQRLVAQQRLAVPAHLGTRVGLVLPDMEAPQERPAPRVRQQCPRLEPRRREYLPALPRATWRLHIDKAQMMTVRQCNLTNVG